MSFLKEFKEDLSQAVNELVDEKADAEETVTEVQETEEDMVNTIDDEEFSVDASDLEAMLDEIDDEAIAEEIADAEAQQEENADVEEELAEETTDETNEDDLLPSDEVADITKGTTITGNIESDGSINVYGKINGDITCKGKLIVTGRISGTSTAGEIFANNAKVEGDVHSSGTIKIGNGSVIVGNVYATSAVIGGAIKGDIDVKGPVIVDGTAVVQGNIKSRSVQINNGAVIEGFCSQCYADIDYKSLFEDTFAIN